MKRLLLQIFAWLAILVGAGLMLQPTDGWNLKQTIRTCLRFLSRKSKLPTAGILMPPPVTCTMIHP